MIAVTTSTSAKVNPPAMTPARRHSRSFPRPAHRFVVRRSRACDVIIQHSTCDAPVICNIVRRLSCTIVNCTAPTSSHRQDGRNCISSANHQARWQIMLSESRRVREGGRADSHNLFLVIYYICSTHNGFPTQMIDHSVFPPPTTRSARRSPENDGRGCLAGTAGTYTCRRHPGLRGRSQERVPSAPQSIRDVQAVERNGGFLLLLAANWLCRGRSTPRARMSWRCVPSSTIRRPR